MRIAVLTPTVPGREHLLAECKEAVKAQTLQPVEHLVELDRNFSERVGLILNEMAQRTDCEWLAPFADDDLMLPEHLLTLAARSDGADVVHSRCEVTGRGGWQPDYASEIPGNALIRRSLWEKLGGWPNSARAEDRDFWLRAKKKGARFVFVDEVTWVYRFGLDANKSLLASHHSFREAHEAANRVHD